MKWIDVKRFVREENERYSVAASLFFVLKGILACCTIIGLPIGFYLLLDVMGIKTRSYLKQIYDIEETDSEVKIIKTESGKYGLLWWKNPDQCRVLQKAVCDEIVRCGEELFILKQNGKYGIHSDRTLSVPLKYSYMQYSGDDKFSISSNANSFINSHGERIY